MRTKVVSFVRQQLAVKGSTKHNGRGAYQCNVKGSSYGAIIQRLDIKIPLWQQAGLIADIKRTYHNTTILFQSQPFDDKFYRTLIVDNTMINVYGFYEIVFNGEDATTL